jgi:drug/metabolite transporter (DMT)-like permease
VGIRDKTAAPYLALIGAQITFGSLPVIGKVVLNVIPAFSLVGFRVGITAVLLLIVQTVRGRVRLKQRGDYWRLALLSLFGVTFNQLLFLTGLSLTKASNTSLLAVTIPIFALSIGSITGMEKLHTCKTIGIVLAALGVIYLIGPQNASFSSQTTIGDLLIVGNSLSYGVYVAISKNVFTRNGAVRSVMWVFIFASVLCVPLSVYSMSSVEIGTASTAIWLLVLYIGIGATAVPYFLNAWALARVNPSTVAVFVYLQPLIGFSLAVAFLGESVDFKFGVAAALIFAGVYMVTRKFERVET